MHIDIFPLRITKVQRMVLLLFMDTKDEVALRTGELVNVSDDGGDVWEDLLQSTGRVVLG